LLANDRKSRDEVGSAQDLALMMHKRAEKDKDSVLDSARPLAEPAWYPVISSSVGISGQGSGSLFPLEYTNLLL
jgi:hypothetical protein